MFGICGAGVKTVCCVFVPHRLAGFHPIIPSMFKPLVYVWRPLMLWTKLVWRQQVCLQQSHWHLMPYS